MKELETLKLFRGATSVIELDFTGFNFEDNSYCQLTIKKKYNEDIIFQHDFNKSIKYYVTFKDEFTVSLDDDKYKYDIMYMLNDERYPQCSISDIIVDEVVNDYVGEFDKNAVQVTEVLAEGVEITQSIKVTTSNVIIVSSNLQERTVTPTKEEQVVLAEDGFDGMSKVVVEAIPDNYVIPKLQDKEARVTAPVNTFIHPDEGYDGLGYVNVIATIDTETKEVTPTKETQVILPSENKLIDQVTINPIPNNYIDPSGEQEITENGNYNVREIESVNVNIQPNLGTKTITENGVYNASDDNLDGYSSVEVETSGVDINEYFGGEIVGASGSMYNTPTWQKGVKKIPALKNSGTLKHLYFQCYATEIDLSGLDFSLSNTMESMFSNCKKIESIDLSQFDTSTITNMKQLFYQCDNLKNINIKGIDTSKVENFSSIFSSCKSLVSLDISEINTENVTDMGSCFSGCTNLTSLDLTSFNTSSVTSMASMFSGCTSLTHLDLSNFNTSNVTNMYYMFNNCTKLTSLDIRNFDFTKVTNYSGMFGSGTTTYIPADCLIIVKDDTAKNWITEKFTWLTNVKTVAELGV